MGIEWFDSRGNEVGNENKGTYPAVFRAFHKIQKDHSYHTHSFIIYVIHLQKLLRLVGTLIAS